MALAESEQEVYVVYSALAFKKLDALLLGDLADGVLHGLVDLVLK